MIKKSDAPPTRSVEAEIEVPGTPEEVWQAVATGHGFSCWFVPTRIEERQGGPSPSRSCPATNPRGSCTADPPHTFVALRKGVDARRSAHRHRDPRGGAHRRHLSGPPRDQPLHEQRRLGRSARGSGEGLADVPPHPAPLPHALCRTALRVHDPDRTGGPHAGRGLGPSSAGSSAWPARPWGSGSRWLRRISRPSPVSSSAWGTTSSPCARSARDRSRLARGRRTVAPARSRCSACTSTARRRPM